MESGEARGDHLCDEKIGITHSTKRTGSSFRARGCFPDGLVALHVLRLKFIHLPVELVRQLREARQGVRDDLPAALTLAVLVQLAPALDPSHQSVSTPCASRSIVTWMR